ncbi:MAG: glycosyltransferase [Rhodocyclales bacterium]|nr:glycosyltransferase [Rhodocyclales bacterium]
MTQICYQVNLQPGWGGGEVYTAFFSRALAEFGVRSTLFVAASAVAAWRTRLPSACEIIGVANAADLGTALRRHIPADSRCWPAPAAQTAALRAAGHLLTCIAHMPLYGRDPASLSSYDLVIPVSGHVLASLRAGDIANAYAEPLYGIADTAKRGGDGVLRRRSVYDWDRRKVRDRLLGFLEPALELWRPQSPFARGAGIALGIVSRLTPIKQFPLLFRHLAPVLARHPRFELHVFGSGGYASVRDLRRALAPLRGRARFWGQQHDVVSVYRQLDYLLTGLPEKEALGLNVIEAQACGLPVLAVAAPPFTETVANEVTGLFYADPRGAGTGSFEALLCRLEAAPFHIAADAGAAHMARFSAAAFAARVARLCDVVRIRLEGELAA